MTEPAKPPPGATPQNIRLRRLKADHERLVAALQGAQKIRLVKTIGSPPEKYHIEYLVKSLVQDPGGQVRVRSNHQVEITLTRAYPRQAPQCRMLTPVFHPNIAPHAICVGDQWAAGEALGSLVVRIGEMLVFQSYNLKSPLDGAAAKWVSQNTSQLPLESFDFSGLMGGEATASSVSESSASGSSEEVAALGARCGRCKATHPREVMKLCEARHLTCPACAKRCGSCPGFVCQECRSEPCGVCKARACMACTAACPVCRKTV